ncbi:MAG: hypothetical protein K2X99_04830 [Gemmatimonadaceae bacterium]|nr:hypothetical protein [Gemmatimonadaceae bacterium]
MRSTRTVSVRMLLCGAALVAACDSRESSAASRVRVVLHERALALGDSVPSTTLACSDGVQRRIGDSRSTQLVTFEALGDCSACASHPAGLDALWREKALDLPMLTVAYAPASQMREVDRLILATAGRPVCYDSTGLYWDRVDLSNTPLTLLLVDGIIAYVHDAPLADPDARAGLVSDVRSIVRVARP